jgi:hypothetical protein
MSDLETKDIRAMHVDSSSPSSEAEKTSTEVATYPENLESAAFDAKSARKLLNKIDRTLIPFLALLYLLSFLDRTNIGNAR